MLLKVLFALISVISNQLNAVSLLEESGAYVSKSPSFVPTEYEESAMGYSTPTTDGSIVEESGAYVSTNPSLLATGFEESAAEDSISSTNEWTANSEIPDMTRDDATVVGMEGMPSGAAGSGARNHAPASESFSTVYCALRFYIPTECNRK